MLEQLTDQKVSEKEYKVLTSTYPAEAVLLMTGNMTAEAAVELLQKVRLNLYTATREQLYTIDGYVFDGRLFVHQNTVYMVKVAKDTRPFVAKIAPDLQQEFQFSQELHEGQRCPTVMQCENCLKIDDARTALIMPFYPMTLHELGASHGGTFSNPVVANIVLCTLSTIKAFANKGLAHCDLKPHNLMLDSNGLVVAIDFGSVQRIGLPIKSTTVSFGIGVKDYVASTEYDLRFLGGMLASFALGSAQYLKYREDQEDVDDSFPALTLLRNTEPAESFTKKLALICFTASTVDEAWDRCREEIQSELPDCACLVDPRVVWPALVSAVPR